MYVVDIHSRRNKCYMRNVYVVGWVDMRHETRYACYGGVCVMEHVTTSVLHTNTCYAMLHYAMLHYAMLHCRSSLNQFKNRSQYYDDDHRFAGKPLTKGGNRQMIYRVGGGKRYIYSHACYAYRCIHSYPHNIYRDR